MLRALRRRVPALCTQTLHSRCLLDEEWLALGQAAVLIIDMPAAQLAATPTAAGEAAAGQAAAGDAAKEVSAEEQEWQLEEAARHLADAGLLELLWQHFWAGGLLVGVGPACAFLGRQPLITTCSQAATGAAPSTAAGNCAIKSGSGSSCGDEHSVTTVPLPPPVLPWYLVRAGGGAAGWAGLQAALAKAAKAHAAAPAAPPAAGQSIPSRLAGVGIMSSGCWLADPCSGRAELLVAPCREALVATAAWAGAPGNDPSLPGLELEEADDDWGYFAELMACCPSCTKSQLDTLHRALHI